MLRRSARVLAIGAALTMLPVAVPAAAHAARSATTPSPSTSDCLRIDPTDTRPSDTLRRGDSWRSGRAAVAALGTRMPQAAALNHRSATELTATLEHDATARLDACSRLLYVEASAPKVSSGPAVAAGAVTDPAPGTVSLAQAFALNSRPGSQRTIMLDFKGGTYTGAFACYYTTAPCVLPAYTIDSDATTFSAAELVSIYRIWQSVAEDYAPFDVNVTTQDTGPDALDRATADDPVFGTRLVITSDSVTWPQCNCGGKAYVGVWPTNNSAGWWKPYENPPAVVVSAGLGWGEAKLVAEAASHEVGHVFGLYHDGTVAVGATAGLAYYYGQGSWAPIMGVSYIKPVTQWSKGEYATANNVENDTAIIAQGAPLMTDDVGNSAATSTPITSGTTFDGLITTPTDSDWFSFTSLGVTQLAVTPTATNPNLDVSLQIYSGTTLVETWNPLISGDQGKALDSSVGGLEAHRTTWVLPAGAYYARVAGTGQDSAATDGYSSYGSLGRYTLTMTTSVTGNLTIASTTTPPVITGTPYSWTASANGGSGAPVTWAVTTGTLPAGLSLSADGTVSGTATTAGARTVTITLTDTATHATASASVTFHVYATVTIADTSLPPGLVDTEYVALLTAYGGGGPAVWSLVNGSVAPPGLTFTSDGWMTGTPTTAATYSLWIRALDPVTTRSAVVRLSLVVAQPLASAVCALPPAMVGVRFSAPVPVTGGAAPFTVAITSGGVAGLTVGTDGRLAGTPLTAGTRSIRVQIRDSLLHVVSQTCSLTVLPQLLVTTTAVPQPTVTTPYAVWLTALGGGTSPRTWSLLTGTLPAGLTLSTTGRLAGTPTTTGRFVVGVRVATADGFAVARAFTIVVAKKLAITSPATLAVGHRGRAYSVSLAATGGYGTRTWTKASGVLPTGLRLSSSGVVFGIATKLGTYVMTVRVRDTAGRVSTKRVTIVVRV